MSHTTWDDGLCHPWALLRFIIHSPLLLSSDSVNYTLNACDFLYSSCPFKVLFFFCLIICLWLLFFFSLPQTECPCHDPKAAKVKPWCRRVPSKRMFLPSHFLQENGQFLWHMHACNALACVASFASHFDCARTGNGPILQKCELGREVRW